ncbi:hypothetical protein [Leptolyngbya ohadii]|uniref:hypothetical protein n=1 Tax=Leptolyngbya ohadii TaxID=1962290 RepID=UPI000B59BD0D|nr:hypothetical protein [Leptolyngbya ohadii]
MSDYQSSSDLIPQAGLRASHFADLVRLAQIIYDPTGGLSGRSFTVDWQADGLSEAVAIDLRILGQRYQFSSPHISPDIIWKQLTPATRKWFIENRSELAALEETFLARDED